MDHDHCISHDQLASQAMSTRDQYEFEEIPNFFKKCKPPPPPGREDLWELQFCRWWGWNWVRKKEEQFKNMSGSPRDKEQKTNEKRKAKKKYDCLCFHRKKHHKQASQPAMQDLFNTPSHSVIQQETYACGVIERQNDSFSRLEIHRNISRKSKRECSRQESKAVQSWTTTARNESGSSEESCCCCKSHRLRSSTEESMEYINICCRCCHHEDRGTKALEKCHCETQTSVGNMILEPCRNFNINNTQTSDVATKICSTQTKKNHKKRICVICCHCRQQNTCCRCNHAASQKPAEKIKLCNCNKSRHNTMTKPNETGNKEKHKCSFLESYATNIPADTMLYYNKHFSKFGVPSQNYPWLNTSKSDPSDQIFSKRMPREFSSPISGKSYNISPIKVETFEKKASSLPDPIGVDEEVQYLRKLESEVKMDLESRVMLDAVCDAILFNDKHRKASSEFLNQLIYSSTESENLGNDLYKSRRTSPKFTKSLIEKEKYYDIVNDDKSKRKYRENETTQGKSINSKESDQVIDIQSDEFIERILEDTFNDIRDDLPRLYSMAPERSNLKSIVEEDNDMSKENAFQISMEKFDDTNKEPYAIKDAYPSLTAANLMLPCKRTSSAISKQEYKKVRLEEPEDSPGLNSSHLSEIFDKIDEIVFKSKVNSEVIQNVLSTIPKSSYQFCTSQNVSNSINGSSNSLTKTIEIKKETGMSLNITESMGVGKSHARVEEYASKKADSKLKLQNTKKKKTPSKQSLIPVKKYGEAKPDKKGTYCSAGNK